MKDLTLIFLNYNTPEWITKALTSLQDCYLSNTKLAVDVVVVDNASTDHSVEKIKASFPKVSLIQAKENNGFAAGNNLALKHAQSRYVMLVNSDVEFTANSNLDELVYYMDAQPEVGVITPRVELADGSIDPASHRGEPTLWASLTYFSGLEKRFPHSALFAQYHQSYKAYDQIHTVDACSGAAMLVRTSAMEKVGLLDERFFMYAEDLDWCKRFRDHGFTIVYNPLVSVIHHKYKSGRGHQDAALSKRTSSHFYQTMLQYFDKHYQNSYPFFVRWGIQFFVWYKTRT